jgi:hypothetical protein
MKIFIHTEPPRYGEAYLGADADVLEYAGLVVEAEGCVLNWRYPKGAYQVYLTTFLDVLKQERPDTYSYVSARGYTFLCAEVDANEDVLLELPRECCDEIEAVS